MFKSPIISTFIVFWVASLLFINLTGFFRQQETWRETNITRLICSAPQPHFLISHHLPTPNPFPHCLSFPSAVSLALTWSSTCAATWVKVISWHNDQPQCPSGPIRLLLPLNTLKYESKCSAFWRHRGLFYIMLSAMYRQWLVKRVQVARKWTFVSLGTWRTDLRFFLAWGMIIYSTTCNAVRFRLHIMNSSFLWSRMQSPRQSLLLHSEFKWRE